MATDADGKEGDDMRTEDVDARASGDNNGTTSSPKPSHASSKRRMSFSSEDIIALEMQTRRQHSMEHENNTNKNTNISTTPSRSNSFKGSETSEGRPSMGRVTSPPALVSNRLSNPDLRKMLHERRRYGR